MSILAISRSLDDDPNIVTIVTDNTLAEVTTVGYLVQEDILADIEELQNGEFQWKDTDIVLMAYSPDTKGFFTRDAANNTFVALPPSAGLSATVPDGEIIVGDASNQGAAVPMSGDATIDNTGAVTIANDAITTAKILDASVTLAKLAAGITPSHVIKFADQVTTAGGAAAEAITVTGAVGATDRAFVQMVDNGTNNVTVLQAVVTDNTLTVTFSADPGADAVINYQLIRAAA